MQRYAKKNPDKLAQMLPKARNEGFMRTYPILGLVELSKNNPQLFREIFNKVVKTGNDLGDYLDFARKSGLGMAKKKAIRNWLIQNIVNTKNSFYAIKYTRQIADAVRLSRIKSDSSLLDYILSCKKPIPQPKLEQAQNEHPQIKAFEEAKKLMLEVKELQDQEQIETLWEKAKSLIEDNQLEVNSLLGMGNPPQKIWQALAKQMGTMQYLKYLNKIINEDAFDEKLMQKKLTVANLQKAKVFPFRLYTAYEYLLENNRKEDAQIARKHLAKILNEYAEVYDWGAWAGKKYCIAPDISGSMGCPVRAVLRSKRQVCPITVAGMFAGFFLKGLEKTVFFPWEHEVRHDLAQKVRETNFIVEMIQMLQRYGGGGTQMNAPVDSLIKGQIAVDIFIGITDSEEWGRSYWGRPFIEAWVEYKQKFPKAKAILLRIDAYNSQPISDKQAIENDIYQVFGWNDNVIRWIEKIVLKN